MGIRLVRMSNGACMAMCALEIETVPLSARLGERPQDAVRANRQAFVEMLGSLSRFSDAQDAAAEILYVTQAVKDQPYRAQARPYVVLRKYGAHAGQAERELRLMADGWTRSLRDGLFGVREADDDAFDLALAGVSAQNARAVTKQTKLNPGMNPFGGMYCYADTLYAGNPDNFERLLEGLSHHPGAAVCMQVIPARYTPQE